MLLLSLLFAFVQHVNASKYLTVTFDPETPDAPSQAYVDGLIQNFFISNDGLVQFESANFTGHKCFGLFADGLNASASWPDEGIIMSSGLPENIVGPNDSGSETESWGLPGDADLNALVSSGTNDACVIEFQFACPPETAAFTPEVNFNYVFGSEEYLEYVFEEFNDVFGFFLNDQNIALVPGTIDTPVTIDTVNNVTNTEFFVDNTGPIRENNQADGYTTLLTATASPADGTNTIKLAIADVGDGQYDSWVLLQAGTFSCTPLTPNPTESPTKNPTKSPTKNPTESPTPSLLQAPPAPAPSAPVPSWCPGELGTDFCLDECVQCTTDGKRPGCVYHHEVGGGKGGGKCSLQCIGCGGTCGLLNAKGKNKNNGKPKPVPGCASQACVNQGKYAEACGV
ncbi:hypothetical protein ACHAXT_011305 [Thalassiosira profunda]